MAANDKTDANEGPEAKSTEIEQSKSVPPSRRKAEEEAMAVASDTAKTALDIVSAQAGAPLAAPSTNLTSELNNIDFRKMIGGPLQAAVDAQVASSLATVAFINDVGFKLADPNDPNSEKELVMVDFSHKRKDIDADGNPVDSEVNIRVPLLAMLPIPSLRIEHVDINFNAKLNSVESSSVSDKLGVNVQAGAGWGPISFKVSVSYQRQTTTNVTVKKEYSISVNVKAVQDEIPAGLEKILNMLAA
jgi:hypothetical protein